MIAASPFKRGYFATDRSYQILYLAIIIPIPIVYIKSNSGGAPHGGADGACEAPQHEDRNRQLIRPLGWIPMPFIPAAELRGITDK